MTATVTVKDIIAQYLSKFSVSKAGTDDVIRFSATDIFYNQAKIVALWRELNARGMKPVAKTFLGRITAISLHS